MSDPAANALLVLRKPTGTIQVTNPFGLGERKLLNALMCHAQSKGLAIGERHEVGLDPDAYSRYEYLRRDVLGPAVADVNAHSNIEVSFERVRHGVSRARRSRSARRPFARGVATPSPPRWKPTVTARCSMRWLGADGRTRWSTPACSGTAR